MREWSVYSERLEWQGKFVDFISLYRKKGRKNISFLFSISESLENTKTLLTLRGGGLMRPTRKSIFFFNWKKVISLNSLKSIQMKKESSTNLFDWISVSRLHLPYPIATPLTLFTEISNLETFSTLLLKFVFHSNNHHSRIQCHFISEMNLFLH